MDVIIDTPGGRGRLHFPGDSWPPLNVLADQAEAGAEAFRHCPDCHNVAASDILTAMAEVAPAPLAEALRALAAEWHGPRPAPPSAPEPDDSGLASDHTAVAESESRFASPALTEAYELYAAELAETEATSPARDSADDAGR